MGKVARTNLSDEVSNWLIQAIESERFKPGERLPSVEQLVDELGVGRSSIREALRRMEALGLVSLRHGVGTFVIAKKVQLGSSLTSFSESIRQRGMIPGSVVLQREVLMPDAAVLRDLKLQLGEQVNYIKRLRLADGEPLVIESSYTPYRLFPGLLEASWSLDTSLYSLLTEKYGYAPAYARQTISAAVIDDEEHSQLLQIEVGSPCLVMYTVTCAADDTPIESAVDVYRADRYQYTVTLVSRD